MTVNRSSHPHHAMEHPILALLFSDWLATNIISLIGIVVTLIGVIYKIAQIGYTVSNIDTMQKHLEANQDAISGRLSTHIADADKHVNHLYMTTIRKDIDKMELTLNGRVEKLENKMSIAFDKINSKLDSIARKQ